MGRQLRRSVDLGVIMRNFRLTTRFWHLPTCFSRRKGYIASNLAFFEFSSQLARVLANALCRAILP